jgi:hypothetical protein
LTKGRFPLSKINSAEGLVSGTRHFLSAAWPILLLVITCLAPSLHAQVTGSILQGIVNDPNGAAVPGVEVQLTNEGTGVGLRTTTNSSGLYEFPAVNPGTYTLAANAKGFAAHSRKGIALTGSQRIRVDVQLQLASLQQTVEVTGTPTVVQTDSGAASHTIPSDTVNNLPLFGRNALLVAKMTPGAAPTFQADLYANQAATFYPSDVAFNGGPVQGNSIMVDGAVAQYGTGAAGYTPLTYSTEEVVVKSFALSAEYGQTSGSVILMESKSGTNSLHGTAWYYHNEEAFNARNFFANRLNQPKAKARHHQPGIAGGGPVYLPGLYDGRNRTFFFADFEGTRDLYGYSFLSTVPTALQRTGDFSQTRTSAGAQINIFDPYTTRFDPNNPSVLIRDPFANNVIPASRINTVGSNLLKFVPLPNNSSLSNNYFYASPFPVSNHSFRVRIDHRINDRNTLYASYGRITSNGRYNGTLDSGTNGYNNFTGDRLITAGFTRIISPSFIFTARASMTMDPQVLSPLQGIEDRDALGFSKNFASTLRGSAFPIISMTDMVSLGQTNANGYYYTTPTYRLGVTKISGRHSISAGYEYRLSRYSSWTHAGEAGTFVFNRAFTQGPTASAASSTAGFGIATLLLGTVSSGSMTLNADSATQTQYHGLYIQDNWRIMPRLTLDYGLRWDYQTPITERYDRITRGFAMNTPSPIAAQAQTNYLKNPIPELSSIVVNGGLLFAGVGGQPRGVSDPMKNTWMPRVGASYQIASKTVLRGGYGLFIMPFVNAYGNTVNQNTFPIQQSGFSASTGMVTSSNNLPYDTLTDPFPRGYNVPIGSSQGLSTFLGQGLTLIDPAAKRAHTHMYQFSIQHELPGQILLDIAYVGSQSRALPVTRNINALPDKYLSLRDELSRSFTNPFQGLITSGSLSLATISRQQLLLPYPEFGGISYTYRPNGRLWYNGLQASANKRLTKGLTMIASYTFSKNMQAMTYLNANQDLERVVVPHDRPHRFTLTGVWHIPFGTNQKYGAAMYKPLQYVIGNWEAGFNGTFQSGIPVPFPTSTLVIGTPKEITRTVDKWFDTSAFTTLPSYTFASTSSYSSQIRSSGARNLDLTFNKVVPIRERLSFRFMAQMYNATNTPQFAPPTATASSTAFGVVSSQFNQPRWFQLGGTLSF